MSITKKYIIYSLSDPRTNEIRYIGKSSSGLKRASAHATPSSIKKNQGYSVNWIKSLIKIGMKPLIEVVEEHQNHEDLLNAEIFYISYFRSLGFNLTNMTTGGEGTPGRKMSEKHKQIIIKTHTGNTYCLGRKLSSTHRAKIGISSKGKPRTYEVKQKISKSNTGKVRTEESKLKISIAKTGLKASQETKDKISASHKGKIRSAEHCQKISLWQIGRKLPVETKNKISASLTGRILSEATRISISRAGGGRPIIDQNGNVYQTVNEAARKLGISKSNISKLLKGITVKNRKGYSFHYLTDEVNKNGSR